jgi:hypothetical protein
MFKITLKMHKMVYASHLFKQFLAASYISAHAIVKGLLI